VKPHAKYILAAESFPISVALTQQQLHHRELKFMKGFEDNYEEKLLTKFQGEYHRICSVVVELGLKPGTKY